MGNSHVFWILIPVYYCLPMFLSLFAIISFLFTVTKRELIGLFHVLSWIIIR